MQINNLDSDSQLSESDIEEYHQMIIADLNDFMTIFIKR